MGFSRNVPKKKNVFIIKKQIVHNSKRIESQKFIFRDKKLSDFAGSSLF